VALLAGGAALGVIVAAVVVPRLAADEPSPTVTVMTRNVYLGANISRPVRAARGQSGPNALAALGRANDRVRETVDSTDFRVRSRLLAAEIAALLSEPGLGGRDTELRHRLERFRHDRSERARAAREAGLNARTASSPEEALGWIGRHADRAQPPIVLILGSLYLAGEVLKANGAAPT